VPSLLPLHLPCPSRKSKIHFINSILKNNVIQNGQAPLLVRDLPPLEVPLPQKVRDDVVALGFPEASQGHHSELLLARVIRREGPRWAAQGGDDIPQFIPLALPGRMRRPLSCKPLDLTVCETVKAREVPRRTFSCADVFVPSAEGGKSLFTDGAELGPAVRRPYVLLDLFDGCQIVPRQTFLVLRLVEEVEWAGKGAGPLARVVHDHRVHVFGIRRQIDVHVRVRPGCRPGSLARFRRPGEEHSLAWFGLADR
jgi:hypothetical protein